MSIMGEIFGKIFHRQAPVQTANQTQATQPAAPQQAAPQAAQPAPVDVNAVLSQLAAKHPEKLNWQTSIVDLMKLLSLDSSLASRKQLAKELGYSGDTSDSAKMNIWLQDRVMHKLAENGGRVPSELLH
jgi:ribonuclease BN (tRNA processing enzyme)